MRAFGFTWSEVKGLTLAEYAECQKQLEIEERNKSKGASGATRIA